MSDAARDLVGRIGYAFSDTELLEQALSHRSAGGRSNERLEFLGDAILDFLVAENLFRRFPRAEEGELTRFRARLVRRETLADIARELGIGQLLRLGGGELKSGGRTRDSILADALEAVLGAIYLDGGLEPCRTVVDVLLGHRVAKLSEVDADKDAKTRLQEFLQSRKQALPVYVVVATEGPAHHRRFTVECRLEQDERTVTGHGSSRRRAEQAAARAALELLGGT